MRKILSLAFFGKENDGSLAASELWEIEEGDFPSWSGKRPSPGLEEIYLVDGRMRIHAQL